MTRGVILAMAGALLAVPAAAQHEGHGQQQQNQMQMQMRMGQGGGGGGGEDHGAFMGPLRSLAAFAPATLLEHGEHLGLTEAQKTALTGIKETAAKDAETAHAPAHAAMMSLRKALDAGEKDLEVLGSYYAAHHTAMGNSQWVQVRAALQARAVLTAEQVKMIGEHHPDGGGMRHKP